MSAEILVSRRSGLVEAEVDGELVGLHIANGSCYGFNRTATHIWSLIERPRTIDEICDSLVAEFEVSREVCLPEVKQLLEQLEREELVDLSPAPANQADR